MPKITIDQILTAKPALRPRIYAYSIADKAHAGLLKVGLTSREVKSAWQNNSSPHERINEFTCRVGL